MKKKTKANVLKAIAVVGKTSAKIGCESASLLGFHQPKEPVVLKFKKSKNSGRI